MPNRCLFLLTFQVKIIVIGRRYLAVQGVGSPPTGEVRNLEFEPAPAGARAAARSAPGRSAMEWAGRLCWRFSRRSVETAPRNGPFPAGRPPGGGRPARDGGEPRYAAVPAQLGRPHPERGPRWPCPLPEGSAWRRTATPPSPTRSRWPLPAVGLDREASALRGSRTRCLHSGSRNALTWCQKAAPPRGGTGKAGTMTRAIFAASELTATALRPALPLRALSLTLLLTCP